jgi:hypothetical protein
VNSYAKVLRAVALGLLLATFPFLHRIIGTLAPHASTHAVSQTDVSSVRGNRGPMKPEEHAKMHGDHDAHHGGQLGMAGDHHLEFVRRGRSIEIYVSDARRNPLTALRGTLDYGDGIARKLLWDETFLRGPYVHGAESVNTLVNLENGEEVEIEFWLSTPEQSSLTGAE